MWIVHTALRRPYTFVVLAVVIALFGVRAAMQTPTDIFPNINIPVVSVVWTYNGLLPNDMSGRVIYYYERTLTAQVGDIEHIESQSLQGYGVVKIFFQKNVDIAAALAQVTAASQTVLKLLPPGITPPYVLSYNASSVPILQLALSSKKLPQMQLFDLGQNFIRPQLATVAGAAVPSPYGGKVLQVQVDLDQQAMQAHNVSADDVVNTISVQNLDSAGRRREGRQIRLERRAQCQSDGCLRRSTICRSRRSMAQSSTCATSPTCIKARRRRPTSCASTDRARC